MNNKVYQILQYLRHSFSAVNSHGHGIHSPLLFDIVQYVIDAPYPYYIYSRLERYRRYLEDDATEIFVEDFGTGRSGRRTVASIARSSLAPQRQAQMLHRLVVDRRPQCVVELGTSLGLTTAYLATADSKASVVTFEGSREIAALAERTLGAFRCDNAEVVVGDIDITLPRRLKQLQQIDILYIDANHTGEAMQRYFGLCLPKMADSTIVVCDDIWWSEDMHLGWQRLTQHDRVTAAFDLYDCGMLFLDPHLQRKIFKLKL